MEADVIQTITGYQNKTRKDFSKTLCIIVREWDKFSVLIQKLKREHLEKQTEGHLKDLQNAKVIKE